MERQVAFLFAVVVACLAGGAYADEHPPIVLVLDPCADVDANEVRRLMPIEMGAPVSSADGDGAAAAQDTTRVSVACVVDSPQLVRLEVRDPTTGKTLERVVTLVGVARSDRGRLVAISAVELVAASRSGGREPEPPPAPKPVAPPVVVAAPPPPSPPEAPPRWRVLAVGGVRGFAGLPRLLPGGGLAVQRAFAGPLSVGGDVMLEGLSQPTSLGDVDTLVGSASAAALLRAEAGRVTWETGLGLRGGFARLSGQASDAALGGTMTARWGGPMLALRASMAAGRTFVVSLGGELGWVTAGVAGHVVGANGQASDVAIRGAWWGATLGVGLAR
jgi:hypothetical protein